MQFLALKSTCVRNVTKKDQGYRKSRTRLLYVSKSVTLDDME